MKSIHLLSSTIMIFIFGFIRANALESKYAGINLAIIDFEGIGVEQNEATVVTDKFQTTLLESSWYRIMERSKVTEVLREQGFQQTGACNSTSCMVQAGNMLGVNYLIAGRISKTAEIMAFSVRLIDVLTGAIVTAASYESKRNFSGFLSTDIPDYSRSFALKIKKAIEQNAMNSQTGLLFVESTPANGDIIIDGEPTQNESPATLGKIKTGKHTIVIKSRDLIGTAEATIKAGELTKCTVTLAKGIASLLVSTLPNNAELFIDGTFISRTPYKTDTLTGGSHAISVKMPGYEPAQESIFIDADSKIERIYTLEALAYIRLRNFDEGMIIWADGKELEPTGSGLIKSTPGKHDLKILKEKFYDFDTTIEITQTDTTEVTIMQKPKKAILNVTSFPSGATVIIRGADGKTNAGKAPLLNMRLKPGKYAIDYLLRQYEPIHSEITLEPAQKVSACGTFSKESAEYQKWKIENAKSKDLNLIFSGMGEIKMDRPVAGFMLFSAGLASDALLGISAYQTVSHYMQKRNAHMDVERNYYQKRQREDVVWLITTLATSTAFRYISYLVTSNHSY